MLANLHIHTEYSMLESAARIEGLAALAVQHDYSACAITDKNNTYGVIKFFQHAKKHNIKPVIGSLIQQDDIYLILLAQNNFGYYEISRLISCRNLSKGDFDLLGFINTRIKNCFILSPFSRMIRHIKEYCRSSVFFELPMTWPEEEKERIVRKSAEMKINLIPTWPVYFLLPEDYEVYKLLKSIKKNQTIFLSEEECADKKNNYFIPLKEFKEQLKKYPGSAERIEKIVHQCNVEFEFDRIELPGMRFSRRRSAFRKLLHLCMRGLNKRRPQLDRPYIERLRKEITVIKKLNLESYFLIVYTIVRFAQEEKISYTGRGSAANSLVCYLLDFTFVDPLEYDLYFERFLHLKRKGLPDVDLDFPWNKRDKVIQFIYDKFKSAHTALISTHITFNVRSAIRETAKAFGLDDKQISRMTKKIPFFFRMESLRELTEKLPEFSSTNFADSLWEKILYYAEKIMGRPRHISIHPGGMVISKRPLWYFTPVEKAPRGFYVTQLNMYDIEKLGLLKIDILGQRSLAVIDRILEGRNSWKLPDMQEIYRDENTINLIKSGQTIGCFYIESPAMRQLLKKLQVRTFRELTAASSVIRPGVAESGMMQKYIEFHRRPSSVTYLHEDMKELLKETYGIMIFQEDVIKIVEKMAGLKGEQGDILRKAMSGKGRSRDAIKKINKEFISGCVNKGYSANMAEQLWAQIESFAGYAFCKAHSASFARISFIVAYLKHYFPTEFMASVLSNYGGFYAPIVYIEEARRLKLKILPPDISRAEYGFVPLNGMIITGLSFIKTVPYNTINRILEERGKANFIDIYDLIRRCNITETEFLILAKCGGLDWTGYNRKQLIFLAGHVNQLKKKLNGSLFLRNTNVVDVPAMEELSLRQKILFELETLGFSTTANPLVLLRRVDGVTRSHEMKEHAGKHVTMMGVRIFTRRIPSKKKNGYMKFISFMDEYGTFESFLSLQNYERLALRSIASSILQVSGRITEEFDAYTLLIDDIKPLFLGQTPKIFSR